MLRVLIVALLAMAPAAIVAQRPPATFHRDALLLDWAALDGVSMYQEEQVPFPARVQLLSHYDVTRDKDDGRVVDLEGTLIVDVARVERLRLVHRSLVYPERINSIREFQYGALPDTFFGLFRGAGQPVSAGEYVDRGWDHKISYYGTGYGKQFEGEAGLPVGTWTLPTFRAALAALPDSLPPAVYAWVAVRDREAVVASVQFGERQTIDVPLAPPGTRCDNQTPVTRRRLWVVLVTEATDTTVDYFVLARSPHLRIEQIELKCLSLPLPHARPLLGAQGLATRRPDSTAGSAPRPSTKGVVNGDSLSEPPVLLQGPPLAYPDSLRSAGVPGRVVVECIIDTTGRVESGSLMITASSHYAFNFAAKDFIAHALFKSGRLNGRAVRSFVQVPVDFGPIARGP
jgi:TonB family protein